MARSRIHFFNSGHLLCICTVLLICAPGLRAQTQSTTDIQRAFHARRDSIIDYYAKRIPAQDFSRGGYLDIAAKLYRNRDMPWVEARIDSLSRDPSGDVFWMYSIITAIYTGQKRLSSSAKEKMRALWQRYMPYRGDTENHWAMYYSALYLISQLYPEDPASTWFTGKSAQENVREARDYLLHWMDLTTTRGQGEYDSPDYFGVFIVPMAQLYAWSSDPDMKKRARMMLEYLIADFAVENLNGLYTGAHSRTYPHTVLEQWRAPSTALAWLLWGNTPFKQRGEALVLALSGFTPPDILHHIATARQQSYVHRERKRTRHRMRFSAVKNAPVYKYTFMRPEYALGSSQGGLLQPIQQHTWDLTWAVPDPRGVQNTFFSIQPHSSPRELGMYFAEHLGFITELVVRSKKTYDSPDKWTGGSPYEQVFQHRDVVITLTDIAPGAKFPHFDTFFSRDISRREIDASGWIFARGGDALIAYYPLAQGTWMMEPDSSWRLRSPSLKNGAVVQVAPASRFANWQAFKDSVRGLPLQAGLNPVPFARFTTLDGDHLEMRYGDTPKINGAPVSYASWPLFESPYMQALPGSRTLTLRYGAMERVLDFNTLTITERLHPEP